MLPSRFKSSLMLLRGKPFAHYYYYYCLLVFKVGFRRNLPLQGVSMLLCDVICCNHFIVNGARKRFKKNPSINCGKIIRLFKHIHAWVCVRVFIYVYWTVTPFKIDFDITFRLYINTLSTAYVWIFSICVHTYSFLDMLLPWRQFY